MINKLLGFFTNPFAELIGGWQARKTAAQKGTIERSKTAMAGWSDEYLLLVWSVPVILIFTPWYEYASRGFERLAALPDWYVGGFISITFAVFGIDKIFKWRGKS